MVLFVVLLLLSRLAQAQAPGSPGAPSDRDAFEGRKDIGQAVIRHLRDGQIETALKRLASVGDGPTPVSFVDDDGFSSACACLHRALSQLDSETQFDLLSKWSMPADQPPRIRFLTALVPMSAPPVAIRN